MTAAPLSTVSVTAQRTLIFGGQGSSPTPMTLVNQSATATVWVGTDTTIMAGSGPVIALAPGDSASFDGSVTVYGITLPNTTAPVAVIPGGSAFTPGSLFISGPVTATISGPVTVEGTVDIGTITGSIDIASVTGTVNVDGVAGVFPPGAYASLISDASGHSLGSSGGRPVPYTTPIVDVQAYQSFSLIIQAYCASQATAGAPLVMPVQIFWYADSAGDYLLEVDTVWCWIPNSAAQAAINPLLGGGPCKGAYAALSFYTTALSATIDVALISMTGNGRSISTARFRQCAPVANINSGITLLSSVNPTNGLASVEPGYSVGGDGIVANETDNVNVAASSTYWLPLPLFNGPVYVRFQTSTALANDFVLCTAAGLQNGQVQPGSASQGCIWNPASAMGTDYTTDLYLGNCPLYLVIRSTVTAPTFSLQIQGVVQ
jgi:hypothetical protein